MIIQHGKDTGRTMASTVPGVKRALEAFIYQVKVVLKENGTLASFWHGIDTSCHRYLYNIFALLFSPLTDM
jgi:hypothetical protein